MKRRDLLQSVLALPLVTPRPASAGTSTAIPNMRLTRDGLWTGLAGLDYALGGLPPRSLSAFLGAPMSGKTLMLLELAARLVGRYRQNVLYYGVHQPSVYTARKVALRGDVRIVFANERAESALGGSSRLQEPAIHMMHVGDGEPREACKLARRLRGGDRFGCAALVLDGWSATSSGSGNVETKAGFGERRASRWPHAPITREVLACLTQFGIDSGVPVVLSVTTTSGDDRDTYADFAALEALSLMNLDRRVVLQRPALGDGPLLQSSGNPDVVQLSGTSPQWWDTRFAKLQLEPGRLRFSTVV